MSSSCGISWTIWNDIEQNDITQRPAVQDRQPLAAVNMICLLCLILTWMKPFRGETYVKVDPCQSWKVGREFGGLNYLSTRV